MKSYKWWLLAFVLFSSALIWYSLAHSQTIDWCVQPLSMQADTHKPMAAQSDPAILWRLRCTIQKLNEERIEALDKAVQMEVRVAEAEAKLKAMTEVKKPAKK